MIFLVYNSTSKAVMGLFNKPLISPFSFLLSIQESQNINKQLSSFSTYKKPRTPFTFMSHQHTFSTETQKTPL